MLWCCCCCCYNWVLFRVYTTCFTICCSIVSGRFPGLVPVTVEVEGHLRSTTLEVLERRRSSLGSVASLCTICQSLSSSESDPLPCDDELSEVIAGGMPTFTKVLSGLELL